MRRRRQLGDLSERGQAALEFVFVVLPVFMLVFFAAEGANVVSKWMILESAAREGARCAAVHQTPQNSDSSSACYISCQGCTIGAPVGSTIGQPVQVTVTYTYSFAPSTDMLGSFLNLIGAGNLASIPMSAQAQMRLEEQTS